VADDQTRQPTPLEGATRRASPEQLDQIWGAIEDGRLDDALALVDEVAEAFPEDADAALARAATYYECGLVPETLAEAIRAGELGLEERHLQRWYVAASQHFLWQFDEARATLDELLRDDASFADGWYLLAQVCEMQEDEVGARRGYERALQLAPERFFRPTRMDGDSFEEAVNAARSDLDAKFRDALDDLALVYEELPTREIATPEGDGEDPLPPDLLGLFVGASRLEHTVFSPVEQPGLIFLFKKNLERSCASLDDLIDEIRTTLYHELAHYLGFEEDDMADLDLE